MKNSVVLLGEIEYKSILNIADLKDELARSDLSAVQSLLMGNGAEWCSTYISSTGALGIILVDIAKMVCIRGARRSHFENIHFGNILHFPLLDKKISELNDNSRRSLIGFIKSCANELEERFPSLEVMCLIPNSIEYNNVLVESGFRLSGECVDQDAIDFCGYQNKSSVDCYSFCSGSSQSDYSYNPFYFLTDDMSTLTGFSNSQTQISLEPTLSFWANISLYTTFSVYPIIKIFAETIFSEFNLNHPKRVLIGPSGAGDFVRFWPASSCEVIDCVDIRGDLIDLLNTRITNPIIDVINYRLCEILNYIQKKIRVKYYSKELRAIFDLVDSTDSHIASTEYGAIFFARTMSEILLNKAIPDWYFPIKQLAASGGCHASIRIDNLNDWLQGNKEKLNKVYAYIQGGKQSDEFKPLDLLHGEYPSNGGVYARRGDLTKLYKSAEKYDFILSWEFIHVFHSDNNVPPGLAAYLDALISNLDKKGTIVITGIRQSFENIHVPQEQLWAELHLADRGLQVTRKNFKFETRNIPFGETLDYVYPVMVASFS